ncbi:HET domain-containing protein [Lasiodiplodia theobromae]|nr:HET domain-containing protein [Lasiodiplodia theobromae]
MKRGEEAVDHSRCNDFECQANQIDSNNYETRHRTEDCNCEFYHVDEGKLQQVIRDERIPYIEMKPVKLEDETKTLQVELQSHKDSIIEYSRSIVIFSHVWSDGLGNPENNALPMCQLQHFYNILRDAPWWDVKAKERQDKANHDRYKERQIKNTWTFPPKSIRAPIREFLGRPVRIWLDTLCVPVKGETKTMAITKLKRYYANADITVVLDAELLRVEHEKCSEGEILLRIALSGWMRRCWTYQEAIIASGRLRVLFADGYYDLPDVVGFMRQLNSIAPYLMSQKQQQRSQDVTEAMTYSATAIGTAFDIYRKSLWIIDPGKALNNALSGGSSTINLGPYINRAKGVFNPKDPFKFLPASERLAADTKSFFAGITAMWAEQPAAAVEEEHERLQNRVHRMVAAWESLRYRTTSHARDRLVNFIFACAKEQRDFVALQKVLDEPADRRFRTWLLDQPALPAGLLFVQGRKMEEHGFRWAPADVHVASVEDDAPARCCVGRSAEEKRSDVVKQARFQTPGLLPVAKDLFSLAKEGIAEYMKEGEGGASGGPRTPALSMTAEGSFKLQKPGFLVRERLRPADKEFYVRDAPAEKSYRVVLDWSSVPPGVTAECLADVGPSLALVLRREPENGSIETAALLKDVAGAETVCTGSFVCRALVKRGKRPSSDAVTAEVTGLRAPDDQNWIVS